MTKDVIPILRPFSKEMVFRSESLDCVFSSSDDLFWKLLWSNISREVSSS